MRYFDCHLHAAARNDNDVDNLAWFGLRGALVVPSRLRRAATADELLTAVERGLVVGAERLAAFDIDARVAVGVPRTAAPRRRFDDVWLDLPALAARVHAAAVGSISATADGADELLEAHARLAAELALPLVVDVRGLRPDAVRSALSGVLAAGPEPARIVVTGADYTTLRALIEAGVVPCVAVGPGGMTGDDAADLVRRFGDVARRFVLGSTDGGAIDVLAIPRVGARLRAEGWTRDAVDKLVWRRGAALFGADVAPVRDLESLQP